MSNDRWQVTSVTELNDGSMKEVKAGEADVLLVKTSGTIYAYSAKCPHNGAPLAEGTLHDERILCPWHQAVFDATTGNLVDPPALDGLHRFEVEVEGDKVYVRVPDGTPDSDVQPPAAYDPGRDDRTFIIVGAGAAGEAAAEALRHEEFQGRIILLSAEERLPYDRPNCSKGYLAGDVPEEHMPLRSADFYEAKSIERICARVRKVDAGSRTIEFENRDGMVADALLIATGSRAINLDVPGADLKNVFTLRTWDDCEAILKAAANAKNAVVVGSSFIGMEAAASLANRDLSVTVVSLDSVPFEKVLGEPVGRALQKLHEENGNAFQLGRKIERLAGKGTIRRVELDDGTTLEADLVVVGIGVQPATGMIENAARNEDGSLKADEFLRVADHVYAAGDIAQFPSPYTGSEIRIEHWRTAQQLGRAAARNMVGKESRFTEVPFFWTRQFGKSVGYVGHAPGWTSIVVNGNPDAFDFSAVYCKDGRALASSGTRSEELAAFSELMRTGRLPRAEDLKSERGMDLAGLLK